MKTAFFLFGILVGLYVLFAPFAVVWIIATIAGTTAVYSFKAWCAGFLLLLLTGGIRYSR